MRRAGRDEVDLDSKGVWYIVAVDRNGSSSLREVGAVGEIEGEKEESERRGRSGRARDRGRGGEGDIPHNQSSPLFGKLINILFSNGITPIQPPFE